MNETPLPLTVCATSAFGASPPSRKRAKAARSAAWSCPSTVSTCQPNARSFASRSPSATISSVRLSDCTSLRSTTTQSPPEALVRGRLERLPVLALLQLPVAGHDDDPPAAAELPLRERDPASLGDAHPERARARLDPGHADVRVPVEPAEAPQPEQTLARDDAEREERRVQPGHVVALRREEDVAVGIVEAALGDVQLLEQQVRDDVERAERGAEVPRAGTLHGDEGVQPARVREQRQPGVGSTSAARRRSSSALGTRRRSGTDRTVAPEQPGSREEHERRDDGHRVLRDRVHGERRRKHDEERRARKARAGTAIPRGRRQSDRHEPEQQPHERPRIEPREVVRRARRSRGAGRARGDRRGARSPRRSSASARTRVGRIPEDERVLGRRRPDLADPAVGRRDVRRLSRGRDRLRRSGGGAAACSVRCEGGGAGALAASSSGDRRVERPEEQPPEIACRHRARTLPGCARIASRATRPRWR